jgi:glycosyltransferase involved in cell wall biosynthesis
MKFVFLAVDCTPFHSKSLEDRPLGGTVTGVIRLSEYLSSIGHEVIVITSHENPSPSKPQYLHFSQMSTIQSCDVFIAIREWKHLFNPPFFAKKRFFWTGDSYDFPSTIGIGDQRFIQLVNGVFVVSRWQAEALCHASGFPLYKTWILRNGVHLPFFKGEEQRRRKRLIYSSLPHRGIIYLPQIVRALQEKHPDIELHIFGSVDRNASDWNPNINTSSSQRISDLFKGINCTVHGSIPQKELAREMMKSTVLAYPCNFEETSCITAMEALAAGCVVVTTDIGALKETVGEAGILIQEKPGSEAYFKKYIEAVDRVLCDDVYFDTLSHFSQERAKDFTWEKTGQSLIDYLRIFHHLQ